MFSTTNDDAHRQGHDKEIAAPSDKQRGGRVTPGVLWQLAKQSVTAWVNDYAASMGAALAYYTLFSLAPLLLLVIAIAGLVFGAEAAQGQVVAQLGGLTGESGATAIQALSKSASEPSKGAIASVISIVTLIIGATSTFGELQSDLDRIWHAPEAVKPAGLWGMLRTRVLSFGLVVSIGFLLLVSLVVSAALAALGTWWGSWFAEWHIVLLIVNQVVTLAFVTALFALMYRILPSVKVGWHDIVVRIVCNRDPLHGGKVRHRDVSRQGRCRVRVRRGRVDRRVASLAVLFGANLPARGRIHMVVRAEPRLARKSACRCGDSG